MRHLDFVSCPTDPDVWMRLAKRSDGADCYEYILLYTDNALVISENAERVLRLDLGRYFELKEESIGPPKLYLGGRIRKVQLKNGIECWAASSSQYVQAAVKNVEEYLGKDQNPKIKLPTRAETPLQTSYRPELDVLPELGPAEAAYYQSLIRILCWIVELGWKGRYLFGSVNDVFSSRPTEGGTFAASTPDVRLPKEVPQHREGV